MHFFKTKSMVVALDNSNDSRREQLRLIQPTMSTPESNNLELLDPSIMADRETSMHVTAWYVILVALTFIID